MEDDKVMATINSAINKESLPKLYFNGTISAHSKQDFIIIGYLNGLPSIVINISPIAAKALYKQLEDVITKFETKEAYTIKSPEEIS